MSFIYSDSETHDLIDVLESRQQNALMAHFQRYPYAARKNVKTVTIDMYSPYLAVINDCFPNAEIIIDRFNFLQHLNRALTRLLIEIMNTSLYTRPRYFRKLN